MYGFSRRRGNGSAIGAGRTYGFSRDTNGADTGPSTRGAGADDGRGPYGFGFGSAATLAVSRRIRSPPNRITAVPSIYTDEGLPRTSHRLNDQFVRTIRPRTWARDESTPRNRSGTTIARGPRMKRVSPKKFSTKLLASPSLSAVSGGALGIGYVLEASSTKTPSGDQRYSQYMDGIALNWK